MILFSADEFGYLVLPPDLATGSSIMPHKRNPDLFELTRARAAALEGDLVTVLQIKGKLTGGYHRDFQLLKEPLMRGLDRTEAMLAMVAHAMPRLGVDRARCAAALEGGALATDEVMRRVEAGRAVPHGLPRGGGGAARPERRFPPPSRSHDRRPARSTGGSGNLGLGLGARASAPRAHLADAQAPPVRPGHVPAGRPHAPTLRPLGGRPSRRRSRPSDDRRPPQAPPQDPRADQHPRHPDAGGAGRGARGGGMGGDPVVGEPGHRRAPAGQGGRRLSATEPDRARRSTRIERRIAEGVLTVEPAGEALVVLHTPPGEANRVAVALDRLAWPDVVGTIAGDDTIFLAVKDDAAQRRVMGEVRRLSGG